MSDTYRHPADRSTLYLQNREEWLVRQAQPRHPFWPRLSQSSDYAYTERDWMDSFRGLLANTDRDHNGPLATFYSESHAIEHWGDARVPVFGMWPKDRMPVVVYARGNAQAPTHRMEFYASQVSSARWFDEGRAITEVYNADVHTLCSRLFCLFSGVWDNLGESFPRDDPSLEPNEAFPVFNVTPDEWALDALKMMRHATRTAWTEGRLWEGKTWYPKHPMDMVEEAVIVSPEDHAKDWAFHASLHYPMPDFDQDTPPLYDPATYTAPDPQWKDTRTVLHVYLGSQRDDYWVDSAKCPICHQRLIIHADKAQCPTGTPASLRVKCPDCKGTFDWP